MCCNVNLAEASTSHHRQSHCVDSYAAGLACNRLEQETVASVLHDQLLQLVQSSEGTVEMKVLRAWGLWDLWDSEWVMHLAWGS